MGFLKDLRTLNKQASEINRNRDVGAEMARASAAMDQANQFLADQAQVGSSASSGTPARLQVLAARDTGTVVNLQAVLELDLLVQPTDGVPYPTTVRTLVPASGLARVAPGSFLTGRTDPAMPASVWIDWTA